MLAKKKKKTAPEASIQELNILKTVRLCNIVIDLFNHCLHLVT